MEVSRIFDSPEARFGVAGPLIIAQYKGAPSLAVLEELERAQTALIEKRGTISTLTVIGELGSMLKVPDGVRQRSVELSQRFASHVRGSAVAITTRGLAAVMVRTFLSGFFLASKFELRTFSTLKESLTWLQRLPGQDAPVRELRPDDIERFLSAE